MTEGEQKEIQSNEEEEIPPEIDLKIVAETERLQQLTQNIQSAIPIRSLPKEEYLEATVIPLLIKGTSLLAKERPEDPIEYLAMFLIKNNPNTPELQKTASSQDSA